MKSKRWRHLGIILMSAMFLASCRSFASSLPTPDPAQQTSLPETSTPAPDYVTQLRNAEYQLGAADSLRVVQLTDGSFEQGTTGDMKYVSVSVADFIAKGTINASGDAGYAMLVSENYGDSGVFTFLAVYADVNGTPRFLASRMVDDRPQVNELSFSNGGKIFLDVVVHKSGDRACCPTLQTTRHYRLGRTGSLVLTDYTTFTPDGRPRTITIDEPANSTDVFGSVRIKGRVDIAPFENNLIYRIVDAGGLELSIGSITVAAEDLGGPGTFEADVLLGNILSGAMIRIEVQDISAENGSLVAMDSVELIVK